MKLQSDAYSLRDLVHAVDGFDLALPEFQRPFVWGPAQIADLLRSVARGWPVGAFLLLEVDPANPILGWRPIEGGPTVEPGPTRLLLDGQQRTTSLYRVLTGQADEVFYINLRSLVDDHGDGSGELDDEDLLYMKASKFVKAYPNIKSQADVRIADVAILTDAQKFGSWCDHLPRAERDAYRAVRSQVLPGFEHYEIPGHRLASTVDLGAVAKVFETINRTGLRLATFDLMVAKLYPSGFRLRDEWEDVVARVEPFSDFGSKTDTAVEILKTLALHEATRALAPSERRRTKGINNSDVIKLSPELIAAGWEEAVGSYAEALRFSRDTLGAIRESLLPPPAMLVVLAHAFRTGLVQELGPVRTARWAWAAAFRQDFAQGANSRALVEAKALAAWAADANAVPEALAQFTIDRSVFLEPRRRNEILLNGMIGLSIRRGARDWRETTPISEGSGPLQVHHAVPEALLTRHVPDMPKDIIANLVPLTQSTNAAIRDMSPHEVVADPQTLTASLSSHLAFDLDLFGEIRSDGAAAARTVAFLEARADALTPLLLEVVEHGG